LIKTIKTNYFIIKIAVVLLFTFHQEYCLSHTGNVDILCITEKKIKYLGVYINSKTNSTDPAVALRKFFGSFSNIMSVVGTARDEMLPVHLVKTYCLPVLLYGSETWSLSSSDKYKLNVAWNNCFRRIFNAA